MDAGPEIETHAHPHTGRPLIDLVLGVSAIAISLISLALAIIHGNAMERLVEASTWPFVVTGISTANSDGTDHFKLVMINKGVGPARIGSLEVFYKGQPLLSPNALLKSVEQRPGRPKITLLTSDVVNNVLSAKEEVNFVDVPTQGATTGQQKALRDVAQGLTFKTCYCSVFNECWTVDTRDSSPRPKPVKACPAPATSFG